MASFEDNKYGEMHQRFVNEAYNQNPKIKNFAQFQEALSSYLGGSEKGRTLEFDVMGESGFKFLFQSKYNRSKIKRNLDEKDFDEMFEKTDGEVKGDAVYELVERKEGKKVNFISRYTPKEIKVNSYTTKNGIVKHGYIKNNKKWSSIEDSYIKKLKNEGVSSEETIKRYLTRFKGTERSSSSVKSKYYRV